METLDPGQTAGIADALIEMTGGRGPDSIIDAVGMEAHGHQEAAGTKLAEVAQRAAGLLPDSVAQKITDIAAIDRLDALRVAVKAMRRGGTVSVSGVYGGEVDPMPMMEMFDRGVQLRTAGQAMMASTVFFSALGWAGDLGAFSRACSILAPSSCSCLRPRPARTLGNQSCSSSSM